MRPREVVEMIVQSFNRADMPALMRLYVDQTVNHQAANARVIGKAAIEAMFRQEFAQADMVCQVENLFEDGEWAILEWKDPLGLRGCGFFHVVEGLIVLQRGYWDKLTFLRRHGLPVPVK